MHYVAWLGLWVKVKCLNREEFVVAGWTDPEGARPWLGSLLLAYYDPEGRLVYAGRAGVGINEAELGRLWRRLQPLAVPNMPLDVPPPRTSRFGSPLVLQPPARETDAVGVLRPVAAYRGVAGAAGVIEVGYGF